MRLSRNPKMIDLTPYLEQLKRYLMADERFMVVYLFGSYGTEYQHALSDVDFGILTRNRLNFDEELEIISKFAELLHEDDVNLVFLNRSDLIINQRVITTGRLIFCRDDVFLADFIEFVIKRYCDFQIDLGMFYQDYDLGLKEEFLGG
jgi:predicted nucleotidyltransferase